MFHGEHTTRARKSCLDLVSDEHDAMLIAQLADASHECRWCCIETALTQYRLDDDRRHA